MVLAISLFLIKMDVLIKLQNIKNYKMIEVSLMS